MADSIRNKTIRNIKHNTVARLIAFIAQGAANIILTRTLLPSDYGIVGFALIFISFLGQFNNFGVISAVIQKKDLSEEELYTGFTIKLFLGVLITILAVICAPLSAYFFENSAVVPVVRALSLIFLFDIFNFLPLVKFTRELNFHKISLVNMTASISGSAIAVIMALSGFSYWSLVASNLAMTIITALMYSILKPVPPSFRLNRNAAKQFIFYGGNLFLTGLITFAIFNADNFIIGAKKGSMTLGYYALAFNWGTFICSLVATIVLSVLFPTFSMFQGDRERLKNAYLKVLEYLSFGGILAYLTLFSVSKEFLILILGHGTDKWLPALDALRILCVYGIFRLVLEPVGNLIMAIGRTDLLPKACLLAAVIEIVLLYPALNNYGIEGVAVLVTISYASQYLVYFPALKHEMNLHYREVVQAVMPSLLFGTLFTVALMMADWSVETVIGLIIKVMLLIFSYVVLYGFITKWRILKETRSLLQGIKTI